MELKRVGFKDEEIEISWEDQMSSKWKTDVTHVMSSKDTPSPEFTEAMQALVAPVIALLELPKKYGDGATFRSLSVSEKGEDLRGYVVALTRPIDATNAPFNIATPHFAEGHLDDAGAWVGAPRELQGAINDLLEVAERFAKGGERQQVDLFEGGEEADVEELETAGV